MKNLNIPVILGTGRSGRYSSNVAKYIFNFVKQKFDSEIIDVRDFEIAHTIPSWIDHPKTNNLKKKLASCDGYIFVVPEYNHSFPGEFKIFFDAVYTTFKRKPVAIISVSSGEIGGSRVIEQLRLISINAYMIPIRSELVFTDVENRFDNKGNILTDEFENRIFELIEELIWFTQVLKNHKNT